MSRNNARSQTLLRRRLHVLFSTAASPRPARLLGVISRRASMTSMRSSDNISAADLPASTRLRNSRKPSATNCPKDGQTPGSVLDHGYRRKLSANRMTPMEKASAAKVSTYPPLCASGAWYMAFPRKFVGALLRKVAMLKSINFTLGSDCFPCPTVVSKRFSKERSQCAIFRSCNHWTAAQICAAMGLTNISRSSPGGGEASLKHQRHKSPSAQNSVATSVYPLPSNTPLKAQAYGKSQCASNRIIPMSFHGLSASPGWRLAKSSGPEPIQLFGMHFTAMARPPNSMSSTEPRFRGASCKCRICAAREPSKGSTLRPAARIESSRSRRVIVGLAATDAKPCESPRPKHLHIGGEEHCTGGGAASPLQGSARPPTSSAMAELRRE
mmetsp:Transcript_127862/g.370033  ORF Transcript_127862/g.370033 Transcript_127862/m.370033 type:complete len:384 (+) Transcript_127862:331-1482(+)